MSISDAKSQRPTALATATDLKPNAVRDLAGALNILLADMFGLYLKTKNFHWHMSGPHFRDYHLLLDEHAQQIFATTDDIAERVQKNRRYNAAIHGPCQPPPARVDNDAEYVTPMDMLAELRDDNERRAASLRETHGLCDERSDIPSASLMRTGSTRPSGAPGFCTRPRADSGRAAAVGKVLTHRCLGITAGDAAQ